MFCYLLPSSTPHFYERYFHTVSQFQLECMSKAKVIQNLPIYWVIHHLPICIYSYICFIQLILLLDASEYWCYHVWLFWTSNYVVQINQHLSVPCISVWGREKFVGYKVVVAIRHPARPNNELKIQPLDIINSCVVAQDISHIHRQSLVILPSLVHQPPNLGWISLQKYIVSLPLNSFTIIKLFQPQPVVECCQKICNCCLPVQGTTLTLLQMCLPLDNVRILCLQKPSHPYFHQLVEHTLLGLPHLLTKLHQGWFS